MVREVKDMSLARTGGWSCLRVELSDAAAEAGAWRLVVRASAPVIC